ncbi:MAG: hypothetical protein U9Q24_00410 [Candidatus Ratteibacteria bacterium]|nr:hypothetical protein [Candidatus Ratteibacteria bacterium]
MKKMSIETRLKKIEGKCVPGELEYIFITRYTPNLRGVEFEKDGTRHKDIIITETTTHRSIEGSSEEGQKILKESGYKVIKHSPEKEK